jgi:hypothetical protein
MSEPMSPETREKLLAELSKQEMIAARILNQMGGGRHLFVNLGHGGMAELYKVAEFTALLRFDLACLFSDYVRHEHSERAHLYARFLILTVYESTKTYRGLLGGDLQKKLNDTDGSGFFMQKVRDVHKQMSRLSDGVAKEYGDVRQGIGAHRDPEALKQLERVRAIGGEELADLYERFTSALLLLERLISEFTGIIAGALQQHLQRLVLPIGSQARITVNLTGASAADSSPIDPSELVWNSANEAVATVDATGVVNAVGRGHSRITFEHPTYRSIVGGAFVLVGQQDELPDLDRLWRSLFEAKS